MPAKRSLTIAIALLFACVSAVRATPALTITLVDLWAGSESSWALDNNSSGVLDGYVYFNAVDPTLGDEVFRTNGETTQRVKDIRPGAQGSSSDYFIQLGDYLYFAARDATHGQELWRTDGIEANTTMVCDIRSGGLGSYPNFMTVLNGNLIFAADDGVNGTELWKFSGESGECSLLKDLYPSASGYPTDMMTYGNKVFFSAQDGVHGTELWTTDGTTAGTSMVKDINVGADNSGASDFTAWKLDRWIVFGATDSDNGRELWRSDGTESGTVMIENLDGAVGSWPRDMVLFQGEIFFSAVDDNSGEGPGRELFKTTGLNNIELVKDIRAGNLSSTPKYMTPVVDHIFFEANDGATGEELWMSDGTAEGTALVQDICPDTCGSSPGYSPMLNAGDALYFFATDVNEEYHSQVWRLEDGTTPVAVKLTASDTNLYTPHTGCNSCPPTQLITAGGRVFFPYGDYGTTGNYGQEFAWLTEPTLELPSTNRGGAVWAQTFALLSCLTAVAGVTLRHRSSRARRTRLS